jgi:hypothetical protein
MANRYVFETVMEGFVNVYEPSGKYNNCCFAYRLPAGVLEQAESDREELLTWAKSKVDNPKRVALNPPKWDDEGLVKFSYGGDTGRPAPVFVDTDGQPIEKSTLRDLRRGTKVKLIVQQSPYTKPAMGTTLKVLGVQVVELVNGNGAVDSGDLSAEDVASIFGKQEGFKASSPSPRDARATEDENDSTYADF